MSSEATPPCFLNKGLKTYWLIIHEEMITNGLNPREDVLVIPDSSSRLYAIALALSMVGICEVDGEHVRLFFERDIKDDNNESKMSRPTEFDWTPKNGYGE